MFFGKNYKFFLLVILRRIFHDAKNSYIGFDKTKPIKYRIIKSPYRKEKNEV